MQPVTDIELARGIQLALQCGSFGEAIEKELQSLLGRWEAQQANAEDGAAFVRSWWREHRECVTKLAAMNEKERRQRSRDYVAYLRTYGATELNPECVLSRWNAEISRLGLAQGGDADTVNTSHDASIIG